MTASPPARSGGQTKAEIDGLLARYGLAPRHAFGQHFLADPNIVERIVRTAGVQSGDRVVEIGAGTGTLTRLLAETGATVVAYELDEGLRAVLVDVLDGKGVDLRFGNALDLDFAEALSGDSWHLVANLPYNVGTPLVLSVLQDHSTISKLTVMLQSEVVDRLLATSGTSDYGVPSVICGLHARMVATFTVPPQVFVPPPAVDSAVVVLERIEAHPLAPQAIVLARQAFGQRRKMLRRSLSGAFEDPSAVLTAAGIDPTRRAETVSPAEYVRLAEVAGK